MSSVRFVYFDLGNVLAFFSHERMYASVAKLFGCDTETVRSAVWADRMSERVERGQIDETEQCRIICERLGKTVPRGELAWAMSDIFTFNDAIVPLIERLTLLEIPRGILSNTGTLHFRHCITTFPLISELIPENHALSYQLGLMKPEREIYAAALGIARRSVADLQPQEVVFLDDLTANVMGASEFGFDVCLYDGTANVNEFFAARGVNVCR
ncbi:MAG: hypothetical protein ACRC46_07990 [Thermoguttaceae bacterium]